MSRTDTVEKKAIVIHSGGMDSSICLALAIEMFGAESVLSVSFSYNQRHSIELQQAAKICKAWGVDHIVLSVDCLQKITHNALMDPSLPIIHEAGKPPNTLVAGRNGLMARLGAIHAHDLGAHCIYMGVIEIDGQNSGYRDCSRIYMDLMQTILRMDLDDPNFEIRTPLVNMTKKETMECAARLGVLDVLLQETVTCYNGVMHQGCQTCPSCLLRNQGIAQYLQHHPEYKLPWRTSIEV
jgi:7-cyano-7-deazaguanine synthase